MRTRDPKKKESIINETIKLVNELGFTGISISKIVDEAGVSPATIYIYYEDKQDLLTKIYVDIREKMGKAALSNLKKQMSIEERFKTIWRDFFKYAVKHPQFISYREQFEQTTMMEGINENEFELFSYITDLFQEGIKKKKIKDLELPFLVSFAFIPIINLLKFHFDAEFTMTESKIGIASDMAWDIIKYSESEK
ncbi:MAG: hypothetical protein BAJALOKI3v1_790015 [Promethearchaeota archaeon]|jgi:AcrR family transcriptional regulator|nr:MAG: hypothetical protein BAJALOKI3v1_790015 [Candidatus Lokiarchaeota archaeon]